MLTCSAGRMSFGIDRVASRCVHISMGLVEETLHLRRAHFAVEYRFNLCRGRLKRIIVSHGKTSSLQQANPSALLLVLSKLVKPDLFTRGWPG